MFGNLTKQLKKTIQKISNRGRLTEKHIKNTIREVRIALLEADVSLLVIKKFIDAIQKKVIGIKINKSLTPGQEFIKVVMRELIKIMEDDKQKLNLSVQPPAVILFLGIQGVGKTTSVVKLGNILKNKNKKVIIASTDIYRPAAITQIEILSKKINIDCFKSDTNESPDKIAIKALEYAKIKFYDVLLIDTAGRMHIDKKMMNEIKNIYNAINPIETLFVIDAMTGQDSINIANNFNKKINITGIILTKTDGDARGGAALSVKYITKKPIKFISNGEKIHSIEKFNPKIIAKRILGMDDTVNIIEEIENKINKKEIEKITNKLKQGENFDLNDFLLQIKQIKKMGGIVSLIEKFKSNNKIINNIKSNTSKKELNKIESIINSMTIKERKQHNIIKGSRKRRISLGSGTTIQDVNNLLKQFTKVKNIMKKIKNKGLSKIIHDFKNMIPKNIF
ncbi:signal recognition particle protein [Buchnera aphidicola (Neophyllaphis podocarpi)]|uniref:signal recognition particle protein n=1 Tax=Buchnera aphidicola TaxID=9 RepID=UPI0031B857F4